MKVFLVACLAVAVMAESDPNLILAPGMYHSGLYNPIVSPISYIQPQVQVAKEQEEKKVVLKTVTAPVQQVQQVVNPIVSPITTSYISSPFLTGLVNPTQVVVGPKVVQKNGQVESILHKRDADADPALMFYNNLYGLPAYRSVISPVVATNKATFINPFTGHVTGKVTNDAILPTNYAMKGRVFARAPGTNTVHIAKRDADPLTVISNPLMYSHGLVNPVASSLVNPIASSVVSPIASTVGVNPLVSSYSLYNPLVSSPVVYSNPAVVAKTVAKPIAENAALGMEGVLDGKTVADDAWQFTPNYAGKGMVEHRTPGTIHRARRDADPLTIYRQAGLYSTGLVNTAGIYGSVIPRTVVRSSLYNPVISTPFLRYY